MIKTIKQLIHDCLTGIDGITYDPSRIYGALAVFTFLGLAISAVLFKNQNFDPQAFGLGFGGLLVGFGLGVSTKSKTEPPA